MSLALGDACYACLKNENPCGPTQTTNTLRVYRDVVGVANNWNIGDTINIQVPGGSPCILFGWVRANPKTTPAKIYGSNGVEIASTTTGQGTGALVLTLTATGQDGDTVTVKYQNGMPAVYTLCAFDGGLDILEKHLLTLNNPVPYFEAYGSVSSKWGSAMLKSMNAYGSCLQESPPV